MCGIVGFIGPGSPEILRRMTDSLVHRGPDGAGYLCDKKAGVWLGHRRLAIIDIEGGAQPMHNEDGHIAIVYNGEIYNHAALRLELIRAGHTFATDHSDTEVLIHGYEEWGENLLPRLNGMFAFAIYDKRRGQLFLARDRFGEKPLYYWQRNGKFAFASSMDAIRLHPEFSEPLDPLGLQKYFAYGFVPSPHGLWRNCRKVPGGASLTVEIATGASREKRYWQFRLQPDDSFIARSEDDVAEELCALLAQAVRRRMISDVPLGVFLSGGIDSSSTLSFAAQARREDPLDSFTIGFEERTFDESGFARRMASFVGSHHHEKILSIQALREVIGKALGSLDEPIADPSIVPTYMLSQFARERVTVALSGDGGDELFAGYDPFKALYAANAYGRLVPRAAHRLLRSIANNLPRSTRNMSLDFRLRRMLTGLSYQRKFWNPVWLSPVEPNDLPDLFAGANSPEEVYEDAIALWDQDPALSLEEQTLKFYTQFYLQDQILVKVDRAAMACSLETRAVFLDNDLAEFSARLPYTLKYRNGRGKYILRKALRSFVPQSLLDRGKKGFGIPTADWLRSIPQVPPMQALGDVHLPWAAQRWTEHRAEQADHRLFLWSWLSAQRSTTAPATA